MNTTGRKGITESQIRDAIARLQAEGLSPSPGRVRSILGTGSYSTIGAVIAKCRDEQEQAAKSEIPEPSAAVQGLFRQVWLEARQAANQSHDSERAGFQGERAVWEQSKAEMDDEIKRLESALTDYQQQLDQATHSMEQHAQELTTKETDLARAMARLETLQNEINHLREQRTRSDERLAELAQRAAKAEALLPAK